MACYSPLKGYKDSNGALVFKRTSHTVGTMEVACGQCLGCRLDRTLMWAMRITHEACLHESAHGNCFVTFTYRSKDTCTAEQYKNGHYVPEDYSLNYHHFRDFIKRLRKHFSQKIRYFHCGEYGEESLRPHYHACLFNCSFDDQFVYQQEQGITTYESDTLQNLWPYGFCTIGELNFETASYTAGYILKKVSGARADDTYLRNDEYGVAYWVKPPYTTMSLGHTCNVCHKKSCKRSTGGIGRDFYEKYTGDFFPSDESPIPGKGIIHKVPRYYQKILSEQSPELLDHVLRRRKEFITAHAQDFTPERLHDKYKCARAQQQKRQRQLQ